MRPIKITPNIISNAEGSILYQSGETEVICTATFESKVPEWLTNGGWITAEYSMLPGATHVRTDRESIKGRLSGRTQEIQRLIGRTIRNVVDLNLLGEKLLKIDCDVISADGGTRTASINGAWVTTRMALNRLLEKGSIKKDPLRLGVSAISTGILNGNVLLDLDYFEDSNADADANFVFNSEGNIIEIQCTGEKASISNSQFSEMFKIAKQSCLNIFQKQNAVIKV